MGEHLTVATSRSNEGKKSLQEYLSGPAHCCCLATPWVRISGMNNLIVAPSLVGNDGHNVLSEVACVKAQISILNSDSETSDRAWRQCLCGFERNENSAESQPDG
jgi:hypothetical protein